MLKGVICPFDQSYQDFETCIACHETMSTKRNCHAPTPLLKAMRDNAKTRLDAGVSASTILACAREHALSETYDYYESAISGYNKYRGTLTHMMMETDDSPPEGVIRERRIERYIDIKGVPFRISGKMDYVDTQRKALVDFKSKHTLPKKPDERHEAQLAIYAYLLADGRFCDTGETIQLIIEKVGIHYLTFETKEERAWLKMNYPLWPLDKTADMVYNRASVLAEWQQTKILPRCNSYTVNRYWKCGCEKIEDQLKLRGVEIE